MSKLIHDGFLELPTGTVVRLIPDPDAVEFDHQYGGTACLHKTGHFRIEPVQDKELRQELVALNTKVCRSGWGDEVHADPKAEIERVLGIRITSESAEGLFALEDGSYLAMENRD